MEMFFLVGALERKFLETKVWTLYFYLTGSRATWLMYYKTVLWNMFCLMLCFMREVFLTEHPKRL